MYLPSHPSSEEFEPASSSQTKILVGKYRGISVVFSRSQEARIPDSGLALRYRGISYLKPCYFS
jgi:Domain of unknown function (DUF4278)